MPTATIAGIVAGLIAIQWIPLPKRRLLAGLIPLGMVIAGADGFAILKLPQIAISPSYFGNRLIFGLHIGSGVGYFVKWFRVELTVWFRSQRTKKMANKTLYPTAGKSPV
jgi:uncharacterized membrane protein AbrB (regulator of aidB expression)